jgi:hypothetical protein
MRLKIAGGHLFDPASGWQGAAQDLYIQDDRIVPQLAEVDRVLEARGKVVCAAGIDLRGQVATYGLNFLRSGMRIPSLKEWGETYAALGYTHVHEPFLTWPTANYVQRQLAALPIVDTSASLVLNLRDLDLWLRAPDQLSQVGETLEFLLEQTRSLNLRVLEPYVHYRQDFYAHRMLAMEKALEILADLARSQGRTMTLEASPELLRGSLPEPRVFHLAALGPALVADDLLPAALCHLEAGTTADLGLINPRALSPPSPILIDWGGFRPLALGPPTDEAAAWRALKLARGYQGPGLAFSGAGPVQAPVADYPALFSWLGSRAGCPAPAGEARPGQPCSLSQWVWATRSLPARLLGLADRGRLSPGARADVAIYNFPPDAWGRGGEDCFRCRTLLKAGEIVVDDFTLVRPEAAKATYYRQTGAEATAILADLGHCRSWRWENLWVQDEMGGPWVGL